MTSDNYGPWKQTSKSVPYIVSTVALTLCRDEEVVVEGEVEVVEGAVDAGDAVGKTIESASRRSRSTTRSSRDTTTVFWDWQRRRNTTSGLH